MNKPTPGASPGTTTGCVIALLGAESSGKSTLADALLQALRCGGWDAVVVAEYLREFCDHHGRTPRAHEQRAIADQQTRRIAAAASRHALVIADTTALMTAVYSAELFGDVGLLAQAVAAHRRCDLTLLAAPDLPWQPDGHQRDGPQARAAIDARLRRELQRAGIGYTVVLGRVDARCRAAMAAIARACNPSAPGAVRPA